MPNIVIVGAQWGDEGKGKVVDVFTPHLGGSTAEAQERAAIAAARAVCAYHAGETPPGRVV